MIEFKCNMCGEDLESPSCLAGRPEKCPKCGFLNRVPMPERLSVDQVFSGESAIVQQLVHDRSGSWEFSLTVELLKPQIAELSKSLDEACAGMRFRKTRVLTLEEYAPWIESQLLDLTRLLEIIRFALEDQFLRAWGAPGEPGDPVEIKRAVDQFVSAGQALVEWEAERGSVVPPEPLQKAHGLMTGWAKEIFRSFTNIPDEIERVMTIPGDHELKIQVHSPDLRPFEEEFHRIISSGQCT